MPSRMDAASIKSVRERCRPLFVCALALVLASAAGCFAFRTGREAPRTENPEIRAASAQNVTPMPVITPPPPPKLDKSAADDEPPLRRLARKAADSERRLGDYMLRIRRRETINGDDQPLEYVLCKFRRAPLSVHCKWLGDEAKGREVVYVKGGNDDKIQVLTGEGDLFGAGRRLAFEPTSILVRNKFRYPITEVGLGAGVMRFVAAAEGLERGDARVGSAKVLGKQNRPEFPRPLEVVEHTIPPNYEPGLPKGGVRFYYFDDTLGLPTLITTFDQNRHQVEYYCFDRLQTPVPLDDADFDCDKLWPRK